MSLWPVALPRATYDSYGLTDFNNAMNRLDDAFPVYSRNLRESYLNRYGDHLYGDVDFARYSTQQFRIPVGASFPTVPQPYAGQKFFHTGTKREYTYGGEDSAWLEATGYATQVFEGGSTVFAAETSKTVSFGQPFIRLTTVVVTPQDIDQVFRVTSQSATQFTVTTAPAATGTVNFFATGQR